MAPTPIIQEIKLPDGQIITIETGKLARQAHGAVVVKSGATMLLATVVSNEEPMEGIDFMPLTVEYREKFSSSGRVPGGFIKREAKPSDEEILVARLVDRALRPLFPEDYHSDTQVIINLISYDKNVAADSLAGLAASAAIAVSNIPFNGPIGEVRVARINGQFKINPSPAEIPTADIDLMVGGTMDSIIMVEGEMKEVSESEMLEALKVAHEAIKILCQAQLELAAKVPGAYPKREYCHETNDEELKKKVEEATYAKVYEVAKSALPKKVRNARFKEIFKEFIESLGEDVDEQTIKLAEKYYGLVQYHAMRNMILNESKRLDGRGPADIRPIWCEVDYLPGAHGSAIFTRGETQSLTTVTLGSKLDENKIDSATFVGSERFYLHYNFPPFSTGEAKPLRGVGRREIGHGNLAQRALKPVISEDIPYTIRVVSDILESNGSSSMATVCAGTLALMDSGIPISAPVSGIAMGLITDEKSGKWAVLSDILGDEDHLGDMDFKVTGTAKGLTACQMDIKIQGLSFEIMEKALTQAKEGRLHILNEMLKTIDKPRPELKPHAPKIIKLSIPKDLIGAVIGPGGKIIQSIQSETGTVIVIEEVNDKGVVEISGTDPEGINEAKKRILDIAFVPTVGEVYTGTVKSIQTYGAFIEIGKGTDGLLHVSEIDHKRIANVSDVLKEGDKIDVKLIAIDEKGKLKLSRKVLLPKPEVSG
ncbi:polyribonucleotide nucleotidyltransferase [Thermaurantimonas aggregans]|uniref:Polyribonucleotide nucleotidyltransferase n=1 Tax=Thermaurantimonas aggregans TaxID=2173829 RepID=A0A401XIK2_9FLAO|nr:polyribonucleotide nucleotidyltransferase [Thermaurantimonas aggregans]MCX8148766.1 polyribonucleotide nucleotidyltransferase [Thermaurantimonas aggregans]GCD76823.1 polyribonucleotide nucleotidyltransferase [Thermaurantimonas aggregans]